MDAIALRLGPGQDLKIELDALAREKSLEAACVLTAVGSLTKAVLRLADQETATVYEGRFELVSLMGVLSRHGSHYHVAIADSSGHTLGGHLLEGCQTYTTAEIVIGVLPQISFQRAYDPATGYQELAIVHADSP